MKCREGQLTTRRSNSNCSWCLVTRKGVLVCDIAGPNRPLKILLAVAAETCTSFLFSKIGSCRQKPPSVKTFGTEILFYSSTPKNPTVTNPKKLAVGVVALIERRRRSHRCGGSAPLVVVAVEAAGAPRGRAEGRPRCRAVPGPTSRGRRSASF